MKLPDGYIMCDCDGCSGRALYRVNEFDLCVFHCEEFYDTTNLPINTQTYEDSDNE